MRIWYDHPASAGENILDTSISEKNLWQQHTLPIGNGDMGANIYGEILQERLTFNEKTLWSGGPSAHRPDYMGGNLPEKGKYGETLKKIQSLFLAGENAAAHDLCEDLVGASDDGYGSFLSWGNLYFDFKDLPEDGVSDYSRDLDLTTAVASVRFRKNGTEYLREFFISHPDNVLAARFVATGSDTLNLEIRFVSGQESATIAKGNTLELAGQLEDNQLRYASYLTAVNDGGSVVAVGDKLTVIGASALTVCLSAATDYKNEYPKYRTGEDLDSLKARVLATVQAASRKSYDSVKEDHIKDYQNLYCRTSLNFGQMRSEKPTDRLLAAYKSGNADEGEQRLLETLLFQFGRYLTIASSREDSQLPANLQGVWNNRNNPPWHSDYHLNVNLQMNYWPTYSTNLAECANPMIKYIDSLRIPGRITARIYAGVESTEENPENGFMAHTQNTPFGWTCPGRLFVWGWSPAVIPWMLQNCWEYYEYTGDIEYLRKEIYPSLRESAVFYDQILVRDADGKLVSSPASSPEHGPRTPGNTYEQSLIWQLYEDAIAAAQVLQVDEDKVSQWKQNQADLKGPIEVGSDGQIKEWYEETALNSVQPDASGHRHMSHLLGLFPGDLIQKNDAWIEAAKVSLYDRTEQTTGWGLAQRLNSWARLGNGEKCHGLIRQLFNTGIFPNLWDTCPPYQIDGNFGYTAGVSEMLIQSNMGYIHLLPALPDAWKDGTLKGFVARGNFEISMDWSKGTLTEATILSRNGGTAQVRYEGISSATVTDKNGNEIPVTVVAEDRVSFETVQGENYTVRI
ncbi:MAG: glycoside hydrolase N-terminal domain-containing protein [Clostridia bacterium]|nr:glycoside hydrolase N-terminal domain-containing protein [Clostridia bacterium]